MLVDRLPSPLHQLRDAALGEPFCKDRVTDGKRNVSWPGKQRLLRHDFESTVAGDWKNRNASLDSHHERTLFESMKKAVGGAGSFRIDEY